MTESGWVYPVLNRRVTRLRLFEKDADYEAFEGVLGESLGRPDAPRRPAQCSPAGPVRLAPSVTNAYQADNCRG
jgi:hypothetical protein